MATAVLTASSYASVVRIVDGRRSSHTMSTAIRPDSAAIRVCAESAAGIEEAPGSVMPSTSAAAVMVEAVPIVMQCPYERAMPSSSSAHCRSSTSPARRSSQ